MAIKIHRRGRRDELFSLRASALSGSTADKFRVTVLSVVYSTPSLIKVEQAGGVISTAPPTIRLVAKHPLQAVPKLKFL